MISLISKLRFIRDNGLGFAAREMYHRLKDAFCDQYFGVSTGRFTFDPANALQDDESVDYATIHYDGLFRLFREIEGPMNDYTMLDYGCGKGRALTVAAYMGVRKIIGVEISDLVDMARTNLDRMKKRKTKDIELVTTDARHFQIPPEVNLVYFYNPFIGSILKDVINNLMTSVQEFPRKLHILFVNNVHFDRCVEGQSWIIKKKQGEIFPDDGFGVYETT